MIDVESFSGRQAEVRFTFTHACEHHDYSRTVFIPEEIASTFRVAVQCPADGMTMLLTSQVIEPVGV